MDQLEEIKSKIDIVEFIAQHITLKKAGRNFKANCPFHKEKTPSFIVSPERQIFKCFGCGVGGDCFKFVMLFEGLSFGEAVRELAKRAGVALQSFRPSKDYEERERLLAINHLAAEYYHFILTTHEVGRRALEYFLKRGIKKSTIEEFALGYAPDSWESLLSFLIDKKKYTFEELNKVGLIVGTGRGRWGGYARFRGRIMFPLKDLQGKIVGFSGRVLQVTEESRGAKYINTPETVLYHKSKLLFPIFNVREAIRKKKTAILVEGEFDVLSSYQAGVKNIVAIKGSAISVDQVRLLSRFAETLTFCLDADSAGDEATRRGIEIAEEAGLNLNVIKLPFGKDVDELTVKDPRAWREVARKPISIYDFYLKSAIRRFGAKTALAKRKVSSEVVPLLSKIGNEIVRAHFIKRVASCLKVSEEAVFEEIKRYTRGGEIGVMPKEGVVRSVWDKFSRQEKLEYYLLSLIVQSDALGEFLEKMNLASLKNKGIVKILEGFKKSSSRKGFSVVKWAKSLPQELVDIFDTAFLVELPQLADTKREKEIEKVLAVLEKIRLHDRLTRLRTQLKEAEGKRERKRVERLSREISEILKKIKN